MDKSIDLTKILKYCPVRTKLYSTIFGEVEFISINKYTYKIKFETEDGMIYSVTSNGRHRYEYNGECTLFPSKDQRDWNKFTAPWYNKLIEHKFHVGQYITNGYVGGKITSIEDNYNCYKILDFTRGINTSIPFTLQDNYHLWTIQDAKDGDVLCCKSGWMCIFKTLNNHTNTFSSYCFMDSDKCFFNIGIDGHTLDKRFINAYNGEIYPATKEQRDLLFQKMKEACYEWDAGKKELKKVKSKFKVGDWIITPTNEVLQITSIGDTTYGFNNKSHYWAICYCDEQCRFWTIKDAKDGDVLAFDNDTIVIFKDLYNSESFHSYCHIEEGIFGFSEDESPDWWNGEGFKPATTEQRDTLMKAINDAGYEWDAEKKELKNKKQK